MMYKYLKSGQFFKPSGHADIVIHVVKQIKKSKWGKYFDLTDYAPMPALSPRVWTLTGEGVSTGSSQNYLTGKSPDNCLLISFPGGACQRVGERRWGHWE